MFYLLNTRRFFPIFSVQFLGAFNDTALRNAVAILITYKISLQYNLNSALLVNLAAGLFIFPFFLLSGFAGQIADTYEKTKIIKIIKLAEIPLIVLASFAFFQEITWLLLLLIFFMGVQSAFFGPLKYGILPNLLSKKEIMPGNSFFSAATFLSILLGTMFGGLLILRENGTFIVSLSLLCFAILGYISSFLVPKVNLNKDRPKMHFNIFKSLSAVLSYTNQRKDLLVIIIGISWFWLLGATFLSQFPSLGKETLHVGSDVVNLFLGLFTIGIGTGNILANSINKTRPIKNYIHLSALGMGFFSFLLYLFIHLGLELSPEMTENMSYLSLSEFIFDLKYLPISLILFTIAVFGGVYTVPLYTLMLLRSPETHRSRVVAANNIYNALFMFISAILAMLLILASFKPHEILLTVSLGNIPIAYLLKKHLL